MNYFFYLTYATFFIPLLVFLFNFKKNKDISARVIFAYVLYSILNEVVLYLLRDNRTPGSETIEAAFVWSFTVFEFLFLAFFLYITLTKKSNKRALLIGSSIFGVTAFLNLFANIKGAKNIEVFDTIPVTVSALTLIIFCIVYLFEKIQSPEIEFIYAGSNFWIIIGIMIYFSGTFFLFLQYSELTDKEQESFWIINWFCILLKNILFAIAFYLPSDKSQSSISKQDLDISLLRELD